MAKSDNTEREQRILDTAVDLFVHYGFDKTTISDIARGAGVSQGSIYLHFDSKDDLLEGVILREMMVFADDWLARVDADPQGGTIGGMYKNMLYALNASAFMSAMFRKDGRILGSYLRKPDNFFRNEQFKGGRRDFIALMQEAGAVRDDVDPKVVAHIINMIGFGLVSMHDVVHEDDIPPVDELIEGIAIMMERAFTPDNIDSSDIGKAIIKKVAAEGRKQYDELMKQGTKE